MTAGAFLEPASIQQSLQQYGMQNSDVIQGIGIAAAYRTLGDPVSDRERIEAAVADVEQLRAEQKGAREGVDAFYKHTLAQWSQRMEAIDEEWKQRLEGYETKVALQAPREYWSQRAAEHSELATRARRTWFRWVAGTIAVSAITAFVLFTDIGEWINQRIDLILSIKPPVINAEPVSALAGLIKKGLVFGSLLAIAVWWLRQLLRELRSHEHLAEDAAERVTMIETYAALQSRGLDAGDLTPILGSLFRPATTGLVDDDGPVLPTEIFLKSAADAVKPKS
jgi:hypothetical protein